MRLIALGIVCLVLGSAALAAQDVIPLYPGAPPGLVARAGPGSGVGSVIGSGVGSAESYPEKRYYSKAWHTVVVTNVTQPTLTVFRPPAVVKNGSAIVVYPGGGFLALSVESEGADVARFLAAKGMTAFLLKYRVAHTGEDGTEEFDPLFADKAKFREMLNRVEPLAVADGLAAVAYVRKHAAEYSVAPDRVGIIGFSAGGSVAAGVAFGYKAESRPAFVAAMYEGGMLKDAAVPADAPPMFIAAATDDSLGLAPVSVDLYREWTAAGKSAELHMYAQGGHGFGMTRHDIPTDHWIDRFAEWLHMEGFLSK